MEIDGIAISAIYCKHLPDKTKKPKNICEKIFNIKENS